MNPHIENVVMQFDLPDGAWTAEPYGNGHINEGEALYSPARQRLCFPKAGGRDGQHRARDRVPQGAD